MAAEEISRDDVAFGRAVLLATDALGVAAEGAFWLYDAHDRRWHYYLVTSLFDRLGSREMYLRLNEALIKTLSHREAQDFSFYIAGPNEPLIKSIRRQVRTEPYASEPQVTDVSLGGKLIKACIYRLSKSLDERRAAQVQRSFSRRYRELVPA